MVIHFHYQSNRIANKLALKTMPSILNHFIIDLLEVETYSQSLRASQLKAKGVHGSSQIVKLNNII
jgi:hypothetical protein